MTNNIILIGFMACGKSAIGRILSERLNYDLIDIDNIIEQKTKSNIKDIFKIHGEQYFRNLESEVILELKDIKNSIIVPGAGAILNFNNYLHLKNLGKIYYLDANFYTILNRINKKDVRPLNNKNLEALFYFRQKIYSSIGENIDVNHDEKEKTVADIIKRHNSYIYPQIFINKQKIYIGDQILKDFQNILNSLGFHNNKYIIITSVNLKEILKKEINYLNSDLLLGVISIKDHERCKNSETINYLYKKLFSLNANRHTLIVSLGGGVVCDLAGFAASTYMRGCPLIHIPTSLLSMVDASLGGKTGFDHEYGKNLIGSFYEARAVIIDMSFLKTLPKEEFNHGMAETIKHAIIGDEELFYGLLDKRLNLKSIIERSIKVKARILNLDYYEKNVRAYLNLGHTFAHAYEKASNYEIPHGKAVSMGLVSALRLSKKLNILEEDFLMDLEKLCHLYDLPTKVPKYLSLDEIIKNIQFDKKKDNFGINFILPKKIGDICIKNLGNLEEIYMYLHD